LRLGKGGLAYSNTPQQGRRKKTVGARLCSSVRRENGKPDFSRVGGRLRETNTHWKELKPSSVIKWIKKHRKNKIRGAKENAASGVFKLGSVEAEMDCGEGEGKKKQKNRRRHDFRKKKKERGAKLPGSKGGKKKKMWIEGREGEKSSGISEPSAHVEKEKKTKKKTRREKEYLDEKTNGWGVSGQRRLSTRDCCCQGRGKASHEGWKTGGRGKEKVNKKRECRKRWAKRKCPAQTTPVVGGSEEKTSDGLR